MTWLYFTFGTLIQFVVQWYNKKYYVRLFTSHDIHAKGFVTFPELLFSHTLGWGGWCVLIIGLCSLPLHNPCVRSAITIATLCWINSMAIQKETFFFSPPSLTCVCKRKHEAGSSWSEGWSTALSSRKISVTISLTLCSCKTQCFMVTGSQLLRIQ